MLEVRGRFAVGDHDDLAGADLVLGQQLLGDQQRVVHVGAEHRFVPAHVRQFGRFQLARVSAEADEVEAVARVLHADQVVERHRHFFRRLERAAQRHRPGEIEHHHRGGLGQRFGAIDLEIVGLQVNGHARSAAEDGVADRLFEVQVERIAELVELRVVGAVAVAAGFRHVVFAEGLALEVGVDFGQRFFADLARAARRELPGVAVLADVTGFFEQFEQVLELFERFARFLAQQLLELVRIDVIEVAAVLHLFERALHLIQLLHVVHQVHT